MGKVGAYEYPDLSLLECEKIAKIIEDKLQGEIKLEPLATLLGHKDANSGAYRIKLTALKRWGLSDGRRLTKLADNLLHPKKDEKWKWVLECIKNIHLFWEMLKRNPDQIPSKETFWKEIVAITDVSRTEAEKESKKIYPIYKNAVEYLSRLKPENTSMRDIIAGVFPAESHPEVKEKELVARESPAVSQVVTPGIDATLPEGVLGRLMVKDIGYVDIKDLDTYEVASMYMKILKKRLGVREENVNI